MITHYPFSKLGSSNHGWLDSHHHFSFAGYMNRKRMKFGVLRVINDDSIRAGAGFDTHPHRNMEIITYVREGAITHKDSNGNIGRTEAGDVQVMSAGTGVFHSEYNLESQETSIFQIWIEPNQLSVKPRWESHTFPKKAAKDKLTLLVSGNGGAPLSIYQDAFIYGGYLSQGTELNHRIMYQAYILISEGCLELEGYLLNKGDGVEVTSLSSVTLKALTDVRVLVIDVPKF